MSLRRDQTRERQKKNSLSLSPPTHAPSVWLIAETGHPTAMPETPNRSQPATDAKLFVLTQECAGCVHV